MLSCWLQWCEQDWRVPLEAVNWTSAGVGGLLTCGTWLCNTLKRWIQAWNPQSSLGDSTVGANAATRRMHVWTYTHTHAHTFGLSQEQRMRKRIRACEICTVIHYSAVHVSERDPHRAWFFVSAYVKGSGSQFKIYILCTCAHAHTGFAQ